MTSILVAPLGLLGLAGLIGYLDDVLLSALAVVVGVTVYGLYRKRRMRQCLVVTSSRQEIYLTADDDRVVIGSRFYPA